MDGLHTTVVIGIVGRMQSAHQRDKTESLIQCGCAEDGAARFPSLPLQPRRDFFHPARRVFAEAGTTVTQPF
jgi:hypothetical protein